MYDLHGIHLDDPQQTVPEGFRRHVTRSTSSISDLKEMKKRHDYVMLHSLFDSLHDDVKASLKQEELEEAKAKGLIDRKVYALGGMNIERVQMARDLGFGGVVVCGDLWNKFSIYHHQDFRELITHFKKLKKATS